MRAAGVIAMLAVACTTEAPERFRYVYGAILSAQCATSACHSRLSQAGGIDLHDADAAYLSLTNRACADELTLVGGWVDTSAPAASGLSNLLRREGPTGMPPNGRLSETEIERLEAWMSAGALCD